MLYGEIIAVCSEIHTKHKNTLCGQNVEFLNVKQVVHIVTTGLQRVKSVIKTCQCCIGKKSLYVLRSIQNTKMHCVGRTKNS